MAGGSTVYDVKIQYSLDDKASAALDHLSAKADETAHHVGSIKEGMLALGELFLGKEALAKGKELFIDLNSQMEEMEVKMSTMLEYNMGTPFEEAEVATKKLISGWLKFSEITPMTGIQITDFGTKMSSAVLAVGGSLEDLDRLSRKGSIVGNLLGGKGGLDQAGLQFREALAGNVRKTQLINQQLLGPYLKQQGLSIDNFNALTGSKRLEVMLGAVEKMAGSGGVKAQAKGWEAVISTLEHKIEMLGMKVGDKLFGALKTDVYAINQWLSNHPKELEAFAENFSSALMTGFRAVKDSIMWLVDHKETLMALGAAWGLGKLAGPLGGNAGAGGFAGMGGLLKGFGSASTRSGWNAEAMGKLANGGIDIQSIVQRAGLGIALSHLTNDFSQLHPAIGTFNTGLSAVLMGMSSLPGPIGFVAGALEALFQGLQWIVGKLDSLQADDVKKAGDYLAMSSLFSGQNSANANARTIFRRSQEMGAIDEYGHLKSTKFQQSMLNQASEGKVDLSGKDMSRMAIMAASAIDTLSVKDKWAMMHPGGKPADDPTAGKPTGKAANVNVNIQKIEVASDDPDRFVFGMTKAFEKLNRNRTQAEGTLRRGF